MGQCTGMCLPGVRDEGQGLDNDGIPTNKHLAAAPVHLPVALQDFREQGRKLFSDEAAAPLWCAACDIVDAVLLGVLAHAPGEIRSVELGQGSEPSICVCLKNASLRGEFATRSRMGGDVLLRPEIRFSVKPQRITSPAAFRQGSASVVLVVAGFEIHPMPDSVELHDRLIDELGEENFCRESVYKWWEEHLDEFSPERSKLRRIYESFLALKTAPLPRWAREKGMWGYVNSELDVLESFEFHRDRRAPGGVTVTAVRRPLADPKAAATVAMCDAFCQDVIRSERFMAERLAASSINYVAMIHGRAVGSWGACPRKIAKLFSAARQWGPGTDGWHRFDDTWLCVDAKDRLGRTIEEQGRIVWRPRGADLTGVKEVKDRTCFAAKMPELLKSGKVDTIPLQSLLSYTIIMSFVIVMMVSGDWFPKAL